MFRRVMILALALGLLVPATASAAKPAVTTGGASSITPTTVTLNGKVDANRKATTFFFQVGTTRLYGSNTATSPAGAGKDPARISVPVDRAGALDDVPLPAGRPQRRRPHARQGPHVQDEGAAARRHARGEPGDGRPRRHDDARRTADGHEQRRPPGRAARQPVPVHAGLPARREHPGHGADGSATRSRSSGSRRRRSTHVQMPTRPEIISPIVVVGVAEQVKTDTKRSSAAATASRCVSAAR